MISFLKKLVEPCFDYLIDGVMAHEYQDQKTLEKIKEEYSKRFPDPSTIAPTPESHPWLFDPTNPPQGWVYDPYYEFWIKKD